MAEGERAFQKEKQDVRPLFPSRVFPKARKPLRTDLQPFTLGDEPILQAKWMSCCYD